MLDNDVGTTMIISQIMKENFQYQKTCGLVYWRRRLKWKMFCTQRLFGGGGRDWLEGRTGLNLRNVFNRVILRDPYYNPPQSRNISHWF